MSPPQTTRPAPEEAAAPLLRPYGQYVLVRKLAEGGMAEIFLAKLLGADNFERNVVIKRMLPHLSNIPDFVEMFRDEARLAAKLSHPNIVQIQELGFTEGCYYICMEYLAGEDFSTTLRVAGRRRHYLPFPIVLRVLIDAAHGLHYAHEFCNESGQPLNIVHRDISPSNLYLTYQGQVKVLDFGIAKAESRLVNTRTGVVKGKYMYMAPEQAQGKEVDRRADVFALGVSLYEALTHVRPFSRENDLAVLNALLHGDFKRPRELRPDLPGELEAIVLKAMSFKPEDRYPSAEAFADDLEAFLGENLSASGSTHLGAFLRGHFGEERFTERTRIPTLATLTATHGTEGSPVQMPAGVPAGTDVYGHRQPGPEVAPARPPSVAAGVGVASAAPQVSVVPAPVSSAPASRRGLMVGIGLAGALLLVGAGVVGYAGVQRIQQSPSIVRPGESGGASGNSGGTQGTAAVMANPSGGSAATGGTEGIAAAGANTGAGATGTPAATGAELAAAANGAPTGTNGASGSVAMTASPTGGSPTGSAQGTSVGTMVANAQGAPATGSETDEVAPDTGRKPEPRAATSKKLVTLGIEDIQRVVSRGRARITSCFEHYKADLPSTQGEVQVQLTIASSGKVQAGTRGPLASTGVGRCLEAQAERLRFPAHRDQEVTVVMPFSWRVTE
ncbi:serine/threonine protein kinase [Pyxidicoccus parkwayensis]|uniref:Serine/threonine protein kinase n=1 Tax=Pyxidicoccus parkwayensis TaxID=2813578 RepID=A0ABX7NPC6_9BACT|nr:protein kinase [Pyxidicoccus parkwaysis]QSQ19405.1 serine/threonine protein kinase [Pyxidicoccus parkwaysis]